MYNFLGIYIFSLYLVPILILLISGYVHFIPAIACLMVISCYYFPIFLSGKPYHNQWQNNISINYIFLFLFLYIVFRYEFIFEVINAIISGNYFNFALQNAIARYSGMADDSMGSKFSTIFFVSFFTSLGIYRGRKRLLWFVAVGTALIESSSLARAGVLLALSCFFVEYMISNHKSFYNLKLSRIIKIFIPAAMVAFIIFTFSAYLRLKDGIDNKIEILIDKLASYTFGIHAALIEWLYKFNFELDFGFNTLTSIFKLLGSKVDQGHYGVIRTEVAETNVFSIIRDLIQDFHIFGASLFFCVLGFSVYYFQKNPSRLKYFFARILILPVIFFLISPYSFTTILIGFLIPFFMQKFSFKSRKL